MCEGFEFFFMHAYMHDCVYACLYLCMYLCMYLCIYLYMHLCTFGCMDGCMYVFKHESVYVSSVHSCIFCLCLSVLASIYLLFLSTRVSM